MKTNARRLAADILFNVYKNDAYLSEELKALRAKTDINNTDFRFVNELASGVIKNKLRIDYIISQNTNIKIKKISAYILAILECAVYQIVFMDKVPASAAVNEAVNLTKSRNLRKSSGFVNGVLRSVLRTYTDVKFPQNTNEYLSVYYSYPLWLVNRWISEFGEERAQNIIIAMNQKPDLFFRANTLKTSAKELAEQLNASGCDATVYSNPKCLGLNYLALCNSVNDITSLDSYRDGMFYIQDFAAALTVEIMDVHPGMTVIDMCAAPGGKTTHMAEKMGNKGTIYAFDVYEHKINRINENASRLGIDIIKAQVSDSTINIPELNGIADRVLVDAPCSGLGIIRRKPDIKYSRSLEDLQSLAEVGYKILENAKNYVKPGGVIIYSTCTIERCENDDVTDKFLKNNKNFEKHIITAYDKQNDGSITLYPDTDNCDGFYICKLKKVSD